MIEEYLIQLTTTNVIMLALLFLCWKYPLYGRYGFAIIFLIASIVNMLTALHIPQLYLEYRQFVLLSSYGTFIEGFFARHIANFVFVIAIGQFLISFGLAYGKRLVKPALIGALVFSIAIIPLGVGSGMPAPVIMGIAILLLLFKKSSNNPKSIVT